MCDFDANRHRPSWTAFPRPTMKQAARDIWTDILFLSLILIGLAAYSYPYFFESLSSNYRQIQTYNLDTMVMLRAVEDGMAAHWFRFDFVDYGHFYFNLTMAAAHILSRFTTPTEWDLVFLLRFFSLAGGYCTIVLTYLFARRYLGWREAIFAALLLAFSPRFIEFSNEVKPDSWQIFFIMLSLYFLARAFETRTDAALSLGDLRPDLGFVMAAWAAAGAAFGTKYQGILLLPLLAPAAWMIPANSLSDRAFALCVRIFVASAIVLGIGLAVIGREAYPLQVLTFLQPSGPVNVSRAQYWLIEAGRAGCLLTSALCFAAMAAFVTGFDFARIRQSLAKAFILFGAALSFAGAFALTSPWLLYHLRFLPSIYFRSHYANEGAWYGVGWLQMIFGLGQPYPQNFVAYPIGVMSVLGAALLLIALIRRDFRNANLAFLLVLGFAATFILFLVMRVNFVTSLYPMPAVPPLILLATYALHQICNRLPRWLGENRAQIGATVLTLVLLATQIWQGGSLLLRYEFLVKDLTPGNKMLGEWLMRCVPPDSRVLAAAYSYIPPSITKMTVNWGPDYHYLVSTDPQIVTVNADDEAIAAKSAAPSDLNRFYQAISNPHDWRPGPAFAPYRVYVKASSAMINPACR